MNADVIIIGAGIAGLRCGIEVLHKRPSANVVIVEKYKYQGGRVVTFHTTLEDIKGRCSKVQWENGAGRVSKSHIRILDLVHHYKLHTTPLSDESFYNENGVNQPNIFEDTIRAYIPALSQLPSATLGKTTLRGLFSSIIGREANSFLLQFPYRAEVDILRADLGIEAFTHEMGASSHFVVVQEGLSAIIQGMVEEFKQRGGILLTKHNVQDIVPQGKQSILVRCDTPAGNVLLEAPKVICALHSEAMRKIPLFKSWDILQHLRMEPLLRIYAVFPTEKGVSWFSDIGRTITADPVRYFIPIDPSCGTAMVSYTDGKDARFLMRILDEKGEEAVEDFIMTHLKMMFPNVEIPDPLFFKTHPWTYGCTYWLPGDYDAKKMSEKALHPFPDSIPGLYCCGESFSLKQAWMEGAVEHADLLLATYF